MMEEGFPPPPQEPAPPRPTHASSLDSLPRPAGGDDDMRLRALGGRFMSMAGDDGDTSLFPPPPAYTPPPVPRSLRFAQSHAASSPTIPIGDGNASAAAHSPSHRATVYPFPVKANESAEEEAQPSPRPRSNSDPSSRTAAPSTAEDRELERLRKRKTAITEILHTERDYVSYLLTMTEVFKRPLERAAEHKATTIISSSEVEALFLNVEDLYSTNVELLRQLEERVVLNWSNDQCIGDVFVQIAPFFKVYKRYCANYDRAVELLYELQESNSSFAQFLKRCESDERATMRLASYLIMPVQRVPRYPMLLEAVLKRTLPNHPDYENLHSALRVTTEVAERVNASMDDLEERAKVVDIQRRILSGHGSAYGRVKTMQSIMAPHRRFIREGMLRGRKVKPDLNPLAEGKRIRLFLFNDSMAVAQLYFNKAIEEFKRLIPLETAWVVSSVHDEPRLLDNYSFIVVCPEFSYLFQVKYEHEKEEWVAAISKGIEDLLRLKRSYREQRAQYKPVRRDDSVWALVDSADDPVDSPASPKTTYRHSRIVPGIEVAVAPARKSSDPTDRSKRRTRGQTKSGELLDTFRSNMRHTTYRVRAELSGFGDLVRSPKTTLRSPGQEDGKNDDTTLVETGVQPPRPPQRPARGDLSPSGREETSLEASLPSSPSSAPHGGGAGMTARVDPAPQAETRCMEGGEAVAPAGNEEEPPPKLPPNRPTKRLTVEDLRERQKKHRDAMEKKCGAATTSDDAADASEQTERPQSPPV